jgi:hypothetical protein
MFFYREIREATHRADDCTPCWQRCKPSQKHAAIGRTPESGFYSIDFKINFKKIRWLRDDRLRPVKTSCKGGFISAAAE